jgi:hypothetical protein
MILSEFRGLVAAFMQRAESTFIHGGVNQLTGAVNMARRWAERSRNFEYCKTSVLLSALSLTNGKALSDAVQFNDRTTPIDIKTVLKAFLPFTVDGVATTTPTYPIDVVSYEAHIERMQRYYEGQASSNPQTKYITTGTSSLTLPTAYWHAFQYDGSLYIAPTDTSTFTEDTIDVGLSVIKWLDPYVDDDDTDFFLEYCSDWLLMRTVYMLNFMIKEDMRVPVSAKAMEETWLSVQKWDANIIVQSTNENSLD